MKQVSILFLAAILGGFTSVGMYKWMEEDRPEVAQSSEVVSDEKVDEPKAVFARYNTGDQHKLVDFTKAADQTIDAVVHVQTIIRAPQANHSNDPFREFFYGGRGYHRAPQQGSASGSGVIISQDGYVVTNNHVIDRANKVTLTLNNKQSYEAEVVGKDPTSDLALLKIEGEELPYVAFGNSDDVKVGEWVLAVGNPFNLNSTVTAGIVSAKGRDINILNNGPNGLSPVESFIQTDAAVNPGNSGGALVNAFGELVGINAAIKSNTGSYTGYSFAIPANIVEKVVSDLKSFGVVQRALIGVSIRNMDARLADEIDSDQLSGVYIADIMEDGAAEMAGIESGDIIVGINDAEIGDVPELQEQLSRYRPGNKVKVTVKRDNAVKTFPVTLQNQYGTTEVIKKEKELIAAALGAEFRQLEASELKKFGLENGLQVKKLQQGKLSESGIKTGFIITKIDRKRVREYEDLESALDDRKGGVLIEGVYPNGRRAYYAFGM